MFVSITTSQEVIKVLLSKYHIVDNPRKFALYEKTVEPSKTGKIDVIQLFTINSAMIAAHFVVFCSLSQLP